MSQRLVSLVAFLLLVIAPAALPADLPHWTDDSGVTLTWFPRHFAPGRETANLVAHVYHPIDSATQISWTIDVSDEAGRVVRRFAAKQTYEPGEDLLLSVSWSGRDDRGAPLPNGMYTAVASIEMHAVGERWRMLDPEEGESGRVAAIHQCSAAPVIIDSERPGRRIEVSAQTPHDPGVPFNFYYGTLHNQTSYSDGGHPNDANCASSTIHGPSDFNPEIGRAHV